MAVRFGKFGSRSTARCLRLRVVLCAAPVWVNTLQDRVNSGTGTGTATSIPVPAHSTAISNLLEGSYFPVL
jgi:hypothetical protein